MQNPWALNRTPTCAKKGLGVEDVPGTRHRSFHQQWASNRVSIKPYRDNYRPVVVRLALIITTRACCNSLVVRDFGCTRSLGVLFAVAGTFGCLTYEKFRVRVHASSLPAQRRPMRIWPWQGRIRGFLSHDRFDLNTVPTRRTCEPALWRIPETGPAPTGNLSMWDASSKHGAPLPENIASWRRLGVCIETQIWVALRLQRPVGSAEAHRRARPTWFGMVRLLGRPSKAFGCPKQRSAGNRASVESNFRLERPGQKRACSCASFWELVWASVVDPETYLSTYLPSCLPTYLPTYLPT